MPVVDVEVGQGSQRDEKHRYGCFNRSERFKSHMVVQDGWWNDGREMVAKAVSVPFRMSHECRYDRSLSDRFCAGCSHAGSGERYIAEREAEGAK